MDLTNEELLLLIGALTLAQRLHRNDSAMYNTLDTLTDKLNDLLISRETD
jgi:hypothetical protein